MEKIGANSNSAALSCLTWIKNNEIEKFRLKLFKPFNRNRSSFKLLTVIC